MPKKTAVRKNSRRTTSHKRHVRVSDHAAVQYIVHVMGLDYLALCREIVPDDLDRQVQSLGGGTYPHPDGTCRLVIEGGTVVTVLV